MYQAPDSEMERHAQHIIGAAIEVHRVLGPGLEASHYREAMAIELHRHGLEFVRDKVVPVLYRDHQVGESRIDFFVCGGIGLTVAAAEEIMPTAVNSLSCSLKRLGAELGLVMNFQVPVLKNGVRRVHPS